MAINVPIHTKTADIAAQAKQLGLGVAELSAEKIAAAPTDILTLAAIESRQIFPYAFDEATTTLHVAVETAGVVVIVDGAVAEYIHQTNPAATATILSTDTIHAGIVFIIVSLLPCWL